MAGRSVSEPCFRISSTAVPKTSSAEYAASRKQERARIQDYVDGYELYDHVLHAGRNPRRMADLGLTDYAVERWALAGAPRDWIARIEQLAERGATKLWVGVSGGDLDAQARCLRLMGEQVMPRFVG